MRQNLRPMRVGLAGLGAGAVNALCASPGLTNFPNVELVAAADRQALVQIALRDQLRDAPDFAHAPHLPHAEREPSRDARRETKAAA